MQGRLGDSLDSLSYIILRIISVCTSDFISTYHDMHCALSREIATFIYVQKNNYLSLADLKQKVSFEKNSIYSH